MKRTNSRHKVEWTDALLADIAIRLAHGSNQAEIAKQYNVSMTRIGYIYANHIVGRLQNTWRRMTPNYRRADWPGDGSKAIRDNPDFFIPLIKSTFNLE